MRKDKLTVHKRALSLDTGKELENMKSKREERAVEIVFLTMAEITGSISEGSIRGGYLVTSCNLTDLWEN